MRIQVSSNGKTKPRIHSARKPFDGGVEKFFNTEMFLNLKLYNIPYLSVPVPHYHRKAGKPTGGSLRVIVKMFKELWDLKMARKGKSQK